MNLPAVLIHLPFGAFSLSVDLAGADTSEAYIWVSSNFTECRQFYNDVFALTSDQAATLVLRDFPAPVPQTTPNFSDDTGGPASLGTNTAITNITVPAATGNPTPTYSASGLPAGVSFDISTRVLSGTPTAVSSGTITITATNSQGSDTWTVAYATTAVAILTAPETPSTPTLTSRTVSSLTLATVAGSGGTPTLYRWRYSTNDLVTDIDPMVTSSTPNVTITGLELDTDYWIDVRAENSEGNSAYSGNLATSTLAIPVQPTAPNWVDDTGDAVSWSVGLPLFLSGLSIVVPVAAANPSPTYSGSGFPDGVGFSPSTRRISGTPRVAGSGTITITATNSLGSDTWTVAYSITESGVPVEGLHYAYSLALWPLNPGMVFTWSNATNNIPADGARQTRITELVGSDSTMSDSLLAMFRQALATWAAVCNVTFMEVADSETNNLRVASGDIEDDIGDGTLGFAPSFPSTGIRTKSAIIMDDIYNTNPTDFLIVAIHEVGHILGLGHVPVLDQVMNPSLSNFGAYSTPQYGDIAGVVGRWGLPTGVTTDTDKIWCYTSVNPANPTGGQSDEDHLPTGCSRFILSVSQTQYVYSWTRTRTYTNGAFTSATAWGNRELVRLPANAAPGLPSTPTLTSRTSSSLTIATVAGGGGVPTFYRWRYSTNSTVSNSDPEVTSIVPRVTIPDLNAGDNYWIDVRAENSAGNSAYTLDLATSTLCTPAECCA